MIAETAPFYIIYSSKIKEKSQAKILYDNGPLCYNEPVCDFGIY